MSGGDEHSLISGDLLTLEVSADFGTGLPTTLGLTWVPPGLVLDSRPTVSGVRKHLTWLVGPAGRQVLTFQASDGIQTARKSITVIVRSSGRTGLAHGDVTADGLEDMIVCAPYAGANDTGAVYVWAGGATLATAPHAVLQVPGLPANQLLAGVQSSPAVTVAEVTGDGVLDIIVRAPSASAGGARRGAVFVWEGGNTLVGQPSPHAVLMDPNGQDQARLGSGSVLIADFDGDGRADVLAVSPRSGPVVGPKSGAVHIWKGGAGLVGTPSPSATLITNGSHDDLLGGVSSGLGVFSADLDQDGDQDIVIAAPNASMGGVERGAVYVWKGRPSIAGEVPPDITLLPPQPADDDQFGNNSSTSPSPRSVFVVDVTGDGALDIVIGGSLLDAGGTNRSRVLVWSRAGALAGTPSPDAVLHIPGDPDNGRLQICTPTDVTGDGVVDVIAFSATQESGTLYVWSGGSTLAGSPAPRATLQAAADGGMGAGNEGGRAVQFRDISGDGVQDIVVTAWTADLNGVTDCGAVFLWAGGSTLAGRPAPRATFAVPGSKHNDRLGFTGTGAQSVRFGDITGDQVPDVVAIASRADLDGVDRGAVYVFEGGSAATGNVAPVASLVVPNARNDDRLGTNAVGQCLNLADLDLDGVLDLIVPCSEADRSAANVGAVYVWLGGTGLRGTLAPAATLARTGAPADERLTMNSESGGQQGVQLIDADGNGLLDAFVAAPTSGGSERGAYYIWKDVGQLRGERDPTTAFLGTVMNAQMSTILFPSAMAVVTDMTGDGLPDFRVLSGNQLVGGRIHVWQGGAPLTSTAPIVLAVPGALSDDKLGDTGTP